MTLAQILMQHRQLIRTIKQADVAMGLTTPGIAPKLLKGKLAKQDKQSKTNPR